MGTKLILSKPEAARRQLATAIELYAASSDPVSIHTLTAAAHGIISDLSRHQGIDSLIVETMVKDWVKPEYKEQVNQMMREAQNFSKHANRDPEATLEFRTYQTEVLAFSACLGYFRLTGDQPPLLQAFALWFMLRNPTCFQIPAAGAAAYESLGRDYGEDEREKYFAEAVPILERIKIGGA